MRCQERLNRESEWHDSVLAFPPPPPPCPVAARACRRRAAERAAISILHLHFAAAAALSAGCGRGLRHPTGRAAVIIPHFRRRRRSAAARSAPTENDTVCRQGSEINRYCSRPRKSPRTKSPRFSDISVGIAKRKNHERDLTLLSLYGIGRINPGQVNSKPWTSPRGRYC